MFWFRDLSVYMYHCKRFKETMQAQW